MNLYDQLTDWIKTNYAALSSDWLYFNAVRMDIGSNSVEYRDWETDRKSVV